MLNMTLKTLICAGALMSAVCVVGSAPAEAASKKFKPRINFSKSMNLRKLPAMRAYQAKQSSMQTNSVRVFAPRRSHATRSARRAKGPVRKTGTGLSQVRIPHKFATESQINSAIERIRLQPRKTVSFIKSPTGGNNGPRYLSGNSFLDRKTGNQAGNKSGFRVPLTLRRNSDLVKTLRNSNKFSYGGTYRMDRGPLQFFGDRANKPATLSPLNQQHLGAPWLRNVPAGSWSKSIHSSNLAISRLNTDLATLRATFSYGGTSAKIGAGGTAYRGVPASRLNKDMLKLYKQKNDCFEFDCVKGNGSTPPSKSDSTTNTSGKYSVPTILSRPDLFGGGTSRAERADSTKNSAIADPKAEGFGSNTAVLPGTPGGKTSENTRITNMLIGNHSRLNDLLGLGLASDLAGTHSKPATASPLSIIDPHPTRTASPQNPLGLGGGGQNGQTGGLTGSNNPKTGWAMDGSGKKPKTQWFHQDDGSRHSVTEHKDSKGRQNTQYEYYDPNGRWTGSRRNTYDPATGKTESVYTSADGSKWEKTVCDASGCEKTKNEPVKKKQDNQSQPRDCAAPWVDSGSCGGPDPELMRKALAEWQRQNGTPLNVRGGRIDWRINPDPNRTHHPRRNVTKGDVEVARKKKRDQVTIPNPLGSPSRYISEEESQKRYNAIQGRWTDPSPE